MVLFQFGKRNPDVVDAEILNPTDAIRWLEKQMLENRIRNGFCQTGDVLGESCNTDINYLLTDPNNPYAGEYDAATSKGYEDPRLEDAEDLRKRKEGTLFSGAKYMIDEVDPSAGGKTVTARGVACVAWEENDFGIPEDSNRCAQVDDIPKPWCFVSDEDWDYCDAAAPARCNTAQNGKKCAPWGENIWGLDEQSDECYTADGEDDPWCYLVEADGLRGSPDDGPFNAWSFCSCTGQGPVRKPKNTFMSGWEEVYADVNGVKTPMIELGASHPLPTESLFV